MKESTVINHDYSQFHDDIEPDHIEAWLMNLVGKKYDVLNSWFGTRQ